MIQTVWSEMCLFQDEENIEESIIGFSTNFSLSASMFVLFLKAEISFCREAMGKILARGHSRVPVYTGSPHNIVGLLLVSYRFSPLSHQDCSQFVWVL